MLTIACYNLVSVFYFHKMPKSPNNKARDARNRARLSRSSRSSRKGKIYDEAERQIEQFKVNSSRFTFSDLLSLFTVIVVRTLDLSRQEIYQAQSIKEEPGEINLPSQP